MEVRRMPFAIVAAAILGLAWTVSSASPEKGTKYAWVEGCGDEDRLCLAFPTNCTSDKTCILLVTVRKDSTSATGQYVFEMAARAKGYVAVSLAKNTSMGSDSVVECIQSSEKVLAYMSLNHGMDSGPNRGNKRLPPEEQHGVSLTTGSIEEGIISCTFQRDEKTTVNGTLYDLSTGSWVLQAAAGDNINPNTTNVKHHSKWVLSAEKLKLSQTGLIKDSYGHSGAMSSASIAMFTLLTALLAHFVL